MSKILRLLLAILSAALMILTFIINLNAQLAAFKSSVRSSETTIKEYISISRNFIDQMAAYADEYFTFGSVAMHPLFDDLQYDPATDTYSLDAISGTENQLYSGNITGMGNLPQSGDLMCEINMALNLGKYFSLFRQEMPEVSWLHYTSERNFIYLYPWVCSNQFSYSPDLKNQAFYSYSTKENRFQNAVWTPVYPDAADKELVVSLSHPINRNSKLAGVLSLDMTTEKLGKMIDTQYSSYLVDQFNTVIASNKSVDQVNAEFSILSGFSADQIEAMEQSGIDKVECIGDQYIYATDIESTPWRLYFTASRFSMLGESALYSAPMLIVCLLLLWFSREVEKRRRTELALSDSLAQVKSYHDLLENSAKLDFLTDTFNRRGFSEMFYEQAVLNDEASPVSLIMGDIDHFKNINDQYGHTAGDRVLVEIASIIKKRVGESGVVGRWGGEEFMIFLLKTDAETAARLAENMRRDIEGAAITWQDTPAIHVTMTFGVAIHNAGDSMEHSISQADSAMYEGKQHGRNRVFIAESSQ